MTQGSTVVSDHGAQLLGAGAVEENLEFVNLVAGIHQRDGIDRVGPGALATQAHGVQRKGNRGRQGGPEFDIIIDHLGRGVDEFNVAGLGGPPFTGICCPRTETVAAYVKLSTSQIPAKRLA